jgi:hypothetical protein
LLLPIIEFLAISSCNQFGTLNLHTRQLSGSPAAAVLIGGMIAFIVSVGGSAVAVKLSPHQLN